MTKVPKHRICTYVPKELMDEIEPYLRHPNTGAIRHGALSRLITRLLREYAAKQRGEKPQSELDELLDLEPKQ